MAVWREPKTDRLQAEDGLHQRPFVSHAPKAYPLKAHICSSAIFVYRTIRHDPPSIAQHEHVALQVRVKLAGDRYPVAHIPGIGMEDDHGRSRLRELSVSLTF